VARYTDSDEFRSAEFVDVSMAGSTFREVNLTGAHMYGVLLTGADIDGDISGLRLNGVEVAPLVEAELDRLHPERVALRADTADGVRHALATVESFWATTMAHVATLPASQLHESVNGEWSFTQTLRHLVFVTDAWFGHAVLGLSRPFHPLGLPASFMTGADAMGIDTGADPTYDEVVQARADRMAQLRDFLAGVGQDDLERTREPNPAPGWPPPAPRTALACLRVIFNEEWTHRQFALRDLARLSA
jgi:DinB superfamily/Pentapeptide repeats (8 copies)